MRQTIHPHTSHNDMVLVSEDLGNNVHEAVQSVNERGLANHVLTIHALDVLHTIIVYRMTAGALSFYMQRGIL